jgi:hypothetical protein
VTPLGGSAVASGGRSSESADDGDGGKRPLERKRPRRDGLFFVAVQQKLLPGRHMHSGRAVSMAQMLAIRRAFAEAARGNRLNLDGEHGHGGDRYSENEFLHV